MLRSTTCALLLTAFQPVRATAQTAEESITVTVVSMLRTEIVAIGGESAGTTITAKGISVQLG